MAIISCALISAGRSGSGTDDFNRTYKTVHQVIVSDPLDGIGTVAHAVDPVTGVAVPGLYLPYVGYERFFSDLNALCTAIDPQVDGPTGEWARWTVPSQFKSSYQIQKQEDPSDDPVLPWVETEFERRDTTSEYDGTPIVSSAGQLYTGLSQLVAVNTYCFLRNELAINPLMDSYNCSVNNATYNGRAKYTLLLQIITDKQQRRNEYVYWPHTYRLKYNPLGWPVDPIDRGTAVIQTVPPFLPRLGKPIGTDNQPIDGEVNLDGNGNLLAAGANLVYLSQAASGQGNGTGKPKMLQAPQNFKALKLPPF